VSVKLNVIKAKFRRWTFSTANLFSF